MQNRIKYLLFFIAVISLFYVVVALFIIPDMQKKHSIKSEIALVSSQVKDLKKSYKQEQESFIDLTWYRNYLENFKGGFSKKDIVALLNMFGESVNIEEINKKDGSLKEVKYRVNLEIKSPKDFYLFLDYLDKNFIPLKIEYPVVFEKEKSLKLNFIMTLYTL